MKKNPQKRAKTTQNGYFLDGKITKKFFFTFSPIPGPNIPKAIKKSKISIIIKNMRNSGKYPKIAIISLYLHKKVASLSINCRNSYCKVDFYQKKVKMAKM